MTYYGKVRGASSTAKFHIWQGDRPPCQHKRGGALGDYEPPRKPLKSRPRPERMCNTCEASEA